MPTNLLAGPQTPSRRPASTQEKKVEAARKILTTYKYPSMISASIDYLSTPYKKKPKINSAKFKKDLLDVTVDMAVNDLVISYSEDHLTRIAETLSSSDGQLFLKFADRLFQEPHGGALLALNKTVKAQAKEKNVAIAPILNTNTPPENQRMVANTSPDSPQVLAKKSAAARRILMAYRYPQLIVLVINDVLKPYANTPSMITSDVRNKLLNAGFNAAIAEIVKMYSEAELNKLADVFTSANGQLVVNFLDKFFQTAQPKAMGVLKTSIEQEAKN